MLVRQQEIGYSKYTIIWIFFGFIIWITHAQCLDGYYDNDGNCEKCHSSWLTCDNANSCTSCSNRYLNETSGLWELWNDGQFYSDSLGICLEWNGSCMSDCAYQSFCFEWSGGRIFNLDTMTCISSWSSTQVQINDPQLRNFNICRSLNYYVDPDGSEIIELGTKKYPYKNIALPFIEILNFHSNTNRTVNIYLKESTTSYIMQSFNYIVNMSLVNIDSYTSNTNRQPENANMFGVGYELQIFSPVTVLNLIINSTLKLSEKTSSSSLSTSEKQALSTTDSNIYVHRSNLKINRVNLYRDIAADNQIQTNFIRAIYLQEKSVTITNLKTQVTGFILYTTDPMSLLVDNVYIDFHATMGGFVMRINCNYPEAYTTGTVKLHNVTCENPIERIAPFREALIMNTGPENYTVDSTIMKIWGSLSEDKGQIEKQLDPSCNPDDDSTQMIQVTNTYWTMPYNPTQDRFVTFYTIFDTGYIRKLIVNYDGNTHENIIDNVYALNLAYTTPNTELWMRNNVFTNVSWLQGAAYTEISGSVILENELYQNSEDFGFDMYAFLYTDSVIITNLTASNVNGTGSSAEYYILLSINEGGTVSLDRIFFKNSDIGKQTGFHVEGLTGSLSITNSIFENLTISSGNTLLSTGEFHSLKISNISFTQVNKETSDDENNLIIRIDKINLDHASESSIDNITIEASDAGFLSFDLITGTTSETVNFNLDGITYKNCNILTSSNLISFGNLESQEDIIFTISDLVFSNMTFYQQTNILIFQQQLLNQLVIKNSVFSDITSGVILLESANKQTLEYQTKVKFLNSTFTNISANYGSLILVNEGANLEITNSTFSNVYCYQKGAVIFAGYQRTTTNIYSSTFVNITSIQGGVFNVEDESVINIYDSEITNNFAVISGVIQASNNGFYHIYNSKIHKNIALSSSVSQIFDVADVPKINNSSLYDNVVISVEDLENELNGSWLYLCYIKNEFKKFLRNNKQEYNIKTTKRLFQLISANLEISNETLIFNEGALIDNFVSTLIIDNSQFYDLETTFSAFTITSSTFEIDSCSFYNISGTDNLALFTVTLDSSISIINVEFYDSFVPFITSLNSDVNIASITIKNVTAESIILDFSEWKSMIAQDWIIEGLLSEVANYPISIGLSKVNLMKNITITNITKQPINILSSNIDLIEALIIKDSYSGIVVRKSNIASFITSEFTNLGKESIRQGGAISLFDSNVTISKLTFTNNTAIEGGAIYHSCPGTSKCNLSISNSTFSHNTGISSGGAVKYDVYRPTMTNNVFENNKALYGPDIASYPIKIKIKDSTSDTIVFTNVGSGIKGSIEFTLSLYDHDEQILILDDSSQIMIRNMNENSGLNGTQSIKTEKGSVTFSETTFISSPGTPNVQYKLSSTGISPNVLKRQYGDTLTQENINISFR